MSYFVFFTGKIAPIGGPSGYLYNLQKGLLEKNFNNVKIIGSISRCNSKYATPLSRKNRYIKFIARVINFCNRNLMWHVSILPSLKRAKVVHFHYSPDFDAITPKLSQNTIKVFTSHSPEPSYLEYQNDLLKKGISGAELKILVLKRKEIDKRAFMHSDRVVFPCIEAVECYSEFLNSINFDYSKIDTVLTGTESPSINLPAHEFRQMHGILLNTKVVCYVGRKTLIKGFDVFLSVASLMRNHPGYCFVCAGVGELDTSSAENVLDLGWTDDPGSLLNACDIVVAPNRSTYFDLGILQAISLGKTVIASFSGGNKWFLGKSVDVPSNLISNELSVSSTR